MAIEVLENIQETVATDCGPFSKTYVKTVKVERTNTANYNYFRESGTPLPMNPYTKVTSESSTPVGLLQAAHPIFPDAYPPKDGTMASCFGSILSNDREDAEARAIAQASRGFYDKLGGVDIEGLVTLAEANKTFSLIGSTATRLARSFTHLRKLQVPEAFDALAMSGGKHLRQLNRKAGTVKQKLTGHSGDAAKLKDFAANSWLEMKYGWTPLLYDVDNAAKALANFEKTEPADFKIRAYAHVPINVWSESSEILRTQGSGGGGVTVNIVAYVKVNNGASRTSKRLGFDDPVSALYELTPYSFVLDWFLPVGDFLSALRASDGLSIVRSCTAVKTVMSGSGSTTLYEGLASNLSESFSIRSFKRSVGVPPSYNILRVNQGNLSKLKTFDKVATSLALLNTAFR